jgi:hypothetical protein
MDGVGMKLDERYFTGGYDPEHPTGNVQFRLEDNEDGTGTFYEFDEEGTIVFQEARTDLEISAPTHDVVELLSQLSPAEFQRVLLLGIAITHPESVWALEYAVEAEDPLAGIQVVRDAAVTALEISEAGE